MNNSHARHKTTSPGTVFMKIELVDFAIGIVFHKSLSGNHAVHVRVCLIKRGPSPRTHLWFGYRFDGLVSGSEQLLLCYIRRPIRRDLLLCLAGDLWAVMLRAALRFRFDAKPEIRDRSFTVLLPYLFGAEAEEPRGVVVQDVPLPFW